MIPGLCIKQPNKNVSNTSLLYNKHNSFVSDILPDNIMNEFYGKSLKYNGKGKRLKKTRRVKKNKKNKTKKQNLL